jgi:hypothetical protein
VLESAVGISGADALAPGIDAGTTPVVDAVVFAGAAADVNARRLGAVRLAAVAAAVT